MKNFIFSAILLSFSVLSTLTSCSQEDYFPTELNPSMNTKGIEPIYTDTDDSTDATGATDSADTTGSEESDQLPIVIVDPEVENIDYTITIP